MRMDYTLTRGTHEIGGTLRFRAVPEERPTRNCPGCQPYIDDVAFITNGVRVELTEDEIREAEPLALDYAAAEVEAMRDEAADLEMERRWEEQIEARAGRERAERIMESREYE